jgi:hypothetical protein
MSVRKTVAATVATKPVGKRVPETAKRTHAKKVAKPAPTKSAPDTVDDISAAAEQLAANIDRALAAGRTDLLTAQAIQALMAAACRSYSAQVEVGGSFPPLAARNRVTSTDVMVTASGLLKSANLAVFELGMWQSWTGR